VKTTRPSHAACGRETRPAAVEVEDGEARQVEAAHDAPVVGHERQEAGYVAGWDRFVVVEGGLGRRSFVRLDAGDTYLRFGGTNMLYAGSGVPWINYPYEPAGRHRFHLTVGTGVRF
jgi:hypothetical protein